MSDGYYPYELRMTPPVTVEVKYGKVKNDRPVKLDHFEVVDREKNSSSDPFQKIDKVHNELGKKPKEVPIKLLSDDISESFSLFRAMFSKKGNLWCGAQYDDDQAKRRFKEDEHGNIDFPVEDYKVECSKECPFWQNKNCDLTGALYFQLDAGTDRQGELAVLRAKGTYAQKQIRSSLEYISKLTGGVMANLPLSLRLHYEPVAQSNDYPIPVITIKTRFPVVEADDFAAQELERRRRQHPGQPDEGDLVKKGVLDGVVGRDSLFDIESPTTDAGEEVHAVESEPQSAKGTEEIPEDIEQMMDDLGYSEMKKQSIYGRFGGDQEKLEKYLEDEKNQQDEIPGKPSPEPEDVETEEEEDDIPFDNTSDGGDGDLDPDLFDINDE